MRKNVANIWNLFSKAAMAHFVAIWAEPTLMVS